MSILMHPWRVAICCVLFGGLSLFWDGTVHSYVRGQQERDRLIERLAGHKAAQLTLARDLKSIHSDHTIETLALETLGWVRPGDLLFVFPGADSDLE